MIHGIINVYKEKGFTSHDVVAKLRGIVGQKKIGHTGYKEGDIIEYMEFKDGRNTGRTFKAEIVYIVNEHRGLTEGFCIIGIKVRPEEKEEK